MESKVDMDHRTVRRPISVALFVAVSILLFSLPSYAQSIIETTRNAQDSDEFDLTMSDSAKSNAAAPDPDGTPDAPEPMQTTTPASATPRAPSDPTLNTGQQTKRILFTIPNFRA